MVHPRAMRKVGRWLLAMTLCATWSRAQPTGATTHVEGVMRMRQAEQARARGDLDEAVRLWREAVEMGAPAAALRGLAMALEQQSRFREAAGAWTRYSALASTERDRAEALQRRESLRTMLTALRVRVTPPPAARVARVWIDRDPPRAYQAGGVEAVASGGRHRVRVESPGCVAWETFVNTGFGEAVEVVAVMRRAP